jgi:hypothetical protein
MTGLILANRLALIEFGLWLIHVVTGVNGDTFYTKEYIEQKLEYYLENVVSKKEVK